METGQAQPGEIKVCPYHRGVDWAKLCMGLFHCHDQRCFWDTQPKKDPIKEGQKRNT